jgi:type VI secretion system protein ImpC
MSNKIEFSIQLGDTPEQQPRNPDSPLKILFFGNFSGRTPDLPEPVRVTGENLADAFRQFHPAVRIESTPEFTLALQSLEGFHPDNLLKQILGADELLSLRRRLQSAATFDKAKAQLLQLGGESPPEPGAPGPKNEAAADFDSLLGGSTSNPEQRDSGQVRSAVSSLISDVVAKHVIPALGEEQATLLAAVDESLSDLLRPVLHSKEFQSLETNWLGLESVVTAIYDDAPIQVFICDTGPTEQTVGVDANELLNRTTLAATDSPWSLMVVADYFGASTEDLANLTQWAALAESCSSALLAGAAPTLVGQESFAATPSDQLGVPADLKESWEEFRASQAATYVGLAAPRILQRQPYGRGSDEIDSFKFEELKPRPAHHTFLWGNPAFALTRAITDAFQAHGWQFARHMQQDIADLPLAIYNDGSGKAIKPAGECLLTDKQGLELVDLGLMPILSYRDRNAAKWAQFKAVSHNAGTPANLGA